MMKNNKAKQRKRIVHGPKCSLNTDVKKHFKEYAASTSAHGLVYLAEDGRSFLERFFWLIVVVLALAFSYWQTSTLYKQWNDNPIITTLETVSLPIKEIEFPAVTICPQGSMKGIAETVLFKQLSRYITNQRQSEKARMKRSGSPGNEELTQNLSNGSRKLTYDQMMAYVDDFLKDVYPGAKDKPTTLVHLLTSDRPQRMIANDAVLYRSMEENCDMANNEEYLKLLNKNLEHETCSNGYDLISGNRCVRFSDSLMDFDEATDYCQQEGAEILQLGSYESFNAFKENKIPSKYVSFTFKRAWKRNIKILTYKQFFIRTQYLIISSNRQSCARQGSFGK